MVSVSKGFQSDDRAERVKRTLGIAASVKGQVGMDQQRDPHSGRVPDEAWMADAAARKLIRVEVFNAMKNDQRVFYPSSELITLIIC